MNKYLVIDTARFVEGVLQLTHAQALPRKHNLEEIKEGIFRVINEVQFKNGEVIGFDGIPSKSLQEVLEAVNHDEAKPVKKIKEVNV